MTVSFGVDVFLQRRAPVKVLRSSLPKQADSKRRNLDELSKPDSAGVRLYSVFFLKKEVLRSILRRSVSVFVRLNFVKALN